MSEEFWNERYRADEYVYGREPNEFLRREAQRIVRGRELCLAEGEGRNAVYLAGLGREVEREVDEGRRHAGTSATVQVRAVKAEGDGDASKVSHTGVRGEVAS